MAGAEPVVIIGLITMNQEVAGGQFLLSCKLPVSFPDPEPGQFVMVKITAGMLPLLRRPFSIHDFSRGDDHARLEILYRVVGGGTKLLASLPPGSTLGVLGPLGNGFTIIPERKNIVIIAGGMGIAPLSFLIRRYASLIRQEEMSRARLSRRIIAYIGTAAAECLVGLDRIADCCSEVKISTEDGSCGFQGNVLELFCRDRAFYNPADAAIYTCGPTGMMKGLATLINGIGFFCQASLEERMACGHGACLGCAVAAGKDGTGLYKRVCKDGPVFSLQDLAWQT